MKNRSHLTTQKNMQHPTPEDLADHIDDTGDTADSIFKAAFQTCNDAGWFLSPEELTANITAALGWPF